MPGRRFEEYGLEQMGMIAEHYYRLREGGRLPPAYSQYKLSDYQQLLPVR